MDVQTALLARKLLGKKMQESDDPKWRDMDKRVAQYLKKNRPQSGDLYTTQGYAADQIPEDVLKELEADA